MNEIVPLQFGTKDIRLEIDEHGEIWWSLTECCEAAGLSNASQAATRLDKDDIRKSETIDRLGRPQETLMINESGLYTLLLRSNKREAKQFQRWVTKEVLPSIRKNGKYEVVKHTSGDMLVEMALAYREQEKRLALMESQAQQTQATLIAQQRDLIATQEMALSALKAMQWVTIRQYVAHHNLPHQIPLALQRKYAGWLTNYCIEHNLPMYKAVTADKAWPSEKTYSIVAINETLPAWLTRQYQIKLVDENK